MCSHHLLSNQRGDQWLFVVVADSRWPSKNRFRQSNMTSRRSPTAGRSLEQCSARCVAAKPPLESRAYHYNYATLCLSQAELDGSPEILLTLSTPSDLPPLDPHLVVHPGVQLTSASSQLDSSGPTQQLRHRKIRFSAPGEQFTLCHYQTSGLSHLPIRGFYQMKVILLLLQCAPYNNADLLCLIILLGGHNCQDTGSAQTERVSKELI